MWPFEYEKISRDLKVCCTSYVQMFSCVLKDVRVNLITLNFLRGRLWGKHSIISSEGAKSSLTVSKTLFLAKNSLMTDNYCLCDVCATYFVKATYLSILYDLLWGNLSNYKELKSNLIVNYCSEEGTFTECRVLLWFSSNSWSLTKWAVSPLKHEYKSYFTASFFSLISLKLGRQRL